MSDQETNSATEQSRTLDGCAECGWQVVTDISLEFSPDGHAIVLCLNPWACWGRQIDLGERYGLTGAS